MQRTSAEAVAKVLTGLPDPAQRFEMSDGKRSAVTVCCQLVMHRAEHRAHIGTIIGSRGLEAPKLDAWAHGIFDGDDDWPPQWGGQPQPLPRFPPPGLT